MVIGPNRSRVRILRYIIDRRKKSIKSRAWRIILIFVKISTELRRGERSVRINLFFIGLISESEVNKKLIIDC
mgnify:CR=1 FL=1